MPSQNKSISAPRQSHEFACNSVGRRNERQNQRNKITEKSLQKKATPGGRQEERQNQRNRITKKSLQNNYVSAPRQSESNDCRDCPICAEDFDPSEIQEPLCVKCLFEMCAFCYHRIKNSDGDGRRCPGCRTPYSN